MTRLIDISLAISSSSLAPPHADFTHDVSPIVTTAEHGVGVSRLSVTTHTGTHVDPPSHFVVGGASVDQLPLERFYGEAYVAELPRWDGLIGPAELDGLEIPPGTTRLLLKTGNSEFWHRDDLTWPEQYAAVSPDGADWIAEHGIELVGIDFLGIEPPGNGAGHPTHHRLLSQGVIVIEGLDLYEVDPGSYLLIALPLRVEDGDGAPLRAALIKA
jgi:arylformamidase